MKVSKPITDTSKSPYAVLRAVSADAVRWVDGFWKDRFEQCVGVTLPHLYARANTCQSNGAFENFRAAAGDPGAIFRGVSFVDSWAYKWLEAASAVLAVTDDDELSAQIDQAIGWIVAAQEEDGYISTPVICGAYQRLEEPRNHELYNMGHLMAAACSHHRATGKSTLLGVATRAADYLYSMFTEHAEQMHHFPWNPSGVMGAVELYRTTGERRYLDLAQKIVDMRGTRGAKALISISDFGKIQPEGYGDWNQDRKPIREEEEVVGHGVFYTYLYAGATDVALETGDDTLREALERLWRDLITTKLYVTGGGCALHHGVSERSLDRVGEAVGTAYELPNATAYNETCTQVGLFMWSFRMLQLTGETRYADLMERELYNGFLPSLGQDGASWFYTNPLRWYGNQHRLLSADSQLRHQPGDGHGICCPTNVLRAIAQLHGTFYLRDGRGVSVVHYGSSTFSDRGISLTQQTDYPWDGRVKLEIAQTAGDEWSLRLRIPEWADGAALTVNDGPGAEGCTPGSFAEVRRLWSTGDTVELLLPMKTRLIQAHPMVESARNQVCVMRGPIVYCLESPDLPDGVCVPEITLAKSATMEARWLENLLGGVTVLEGEFVRTQEDDWSGELYRELPTATTSAVSTHLIPYYAWANRGVSEMTVWLPLAAT